VFQHDQWGNDRGLPGCSPPPQTPQNRNLKNTDFVDIMKSKVLRDFPFSQNQSLKSADDRYIKILENGFNNFALYRDTAVKLFLL
jgi:hypothetical protein